ncbi:hypothetical protein SAMN05443572_115187 [Myxococcus fulvus]|uniref:Uncharacterized protein n=1 Tax=Myxococcus fulvus TaxID=33 RepID=A0A511TCB1_MYXFU|nr:hypothetical protein [Myxococcus fulvus]GEN11825.1 hypothetical protein MFU01_68620 [Myxococcus fulvus]SEU40620.1 hypothetical protein SAMN05443572_115187 [Myxococcus fulvus]
MTNESRRTTRPLDASRPIVPTFTRTLSDVKDGQSGHTRARATHVGIAETRGGHS